VLAGGLTVILWLKRRRYAALALAAGVGGAAAMNLVLKYLFERTRPDLWTRLVHETSFSFPSGHAMASSALAFSLIVIFWRTRWRWWIIAAGVLYMVTIGFTRLYLGVHYPTDIIGGWVVSMGWVAIVAAVISEYINRRQRLNDAA
jgi:undecaprenyl-diphosphatase